MPDVGAFDSAPAAQAADMLRACCGASRWVANMVARRPFGSRAAVVTAASQVWRSLGPGDWHEAFRHHPRIGERAGEISQPARGSSWSAEEQAQMAGAADDVRQLLAAANRAYEQHFGYLYIVNAAGKSPDAMLQLARQRLNNPPELELQIAAGEQEQIMLDRLQKLLDDDRDPRDRQ